MSRQSTHKPKRSLFRRINEWLHLWLGLASGIVVFVVCLTACFWVFRYEVWYFTETYQRVTPQQKPFLPPSIILNKASDFARRVEGKPVTFTGITYGGPNKSVFTNYTPVEGKYYSIYLNPYTGQIIHHKKGPSSSEAFFGFVRSGHRFFFLPPKIGSPIVGASCIIFVITMITGLIWWYPKKWTKATREKSFKIKWNANWKRVNLDLHNVLGFYSLLICLALTISGIVYSFRWFDKGYYWLLTGKEQVGAHGHAEHPVSDTTITTRVYAKPEDKIWQLIRREHPDPVGRLSISFPDEAKDPYQVSINPEDGTIYKTFTRFFDQNTLKELPSEESKRYEELSSVVEKLYRMNFDIHVGQIYGLPTRVLAFFVSLIGASLPVTGFIIWWFRGKKSSKKNRKAARQSSDLERSL